MHNVSWLTFGGRTRPGSSPKSLEHPCRDKVDRVMEKDEVGIFCRLLVIIATGPLVRIRWTPGVLGNCGDANTTRRDSIVAFIAICHFLLFVYGY